MSVINAGATSCPREMAAMAAMERIEEIGTASDTAHTEGAVLASMAACGELCTLAGICLASNPSKDSGIIDMYTGLFEQAANIGTDCEVIVD